jgi:diadenosine tetraphosphatase ApaH/serine/threonine PP2A family protein phosphatase
MMHFAVISDVHANLDALIAVMEDIKQRKMEDIFFLGDAVGYGPNPNECIDLLKKNCKVLLAGNHDWGALGITDITHFNEYARYAIEWTKHVLTEEAGRILRSLPLKEELRERDIFLVHSTPRAPEEWHYLLTLWDAEINFHYFQNKFCFLGHSHQPFILEMEPTGELVTYREMATIRESSRYIINVGSIGQPRDGDPRACYTIIEDSKVEMVRVEYDVEGVQNKMMKERLPYPLIERLSVGR